MSDGKDLEAYLSEDESGDAPQSISEDDLSFDGDKKPFFQQNLTPQKGNSHGKSSKRDIYGKRPPGSSRRSKKRQQRKNNYFSNEDGSSSSSELEFQDDVHKITDVHEIDTVENSNNTSKISFGEPMDISDASAEPFTDSSFGEEYETVEKPEKEEKVEKTEVSEKEVKTENKAVEEVSKKEENEKVEENKENTENKEKSEIKNPNLTPEDENTEENTENMENSEKNKSENVFDDIISSLRNLSRHSIGREKPAFPLPSSQALRLDSMHRSRAYEDSLDRKESEEEGIPEKISGICLYRAISPDVDKNYGLHNVHPVISITNQEEANQQLRELDRQAALQANNQETEGEQDNFNANNEEYAQEENRFPVNDDKVMEILREAGEIDTITEEEEAISDDYPHLLPTERIKGFKFGNKSYLASTEDIYNMHPTSDPVLAEMKQLALNRQRLPNVNDEYFVQLIDMLVSDKYDFIQKKLFEEASCTSRSIEFTQSERIRIQKEEFLRDAQDHHKSNVENLQRELKEFDEQTRLLMNQLRNEQNNQKTRIIEQHENETNQLMNLWTSDQKVRLYNRASQKLVQLRAQFQLLLENGAFDDAKALQREISELEAKEMRESHAQMQRDFDCAVENLKRKHESEMDSFNSKVDVQNRQFAQRRSIEKIPLERKQKRINIEAKKIKDPDKLWTKKQMQQKEESYTNILPKSTLPIFKPNGRNFKPKPNLMIALPPIDMSKGRKMTKSKLPPLPGFQ